MGDDLINANPNVRDEESLPQRTNASKQLSVHQRTENYLNGLLNTLTFNSNDSSEVISETAIEELVDEQEIYDLISSISDPEHPLTLGQLSVVNLNDIKITHPDLKKHLKGLISVQITPTITHCSLATLIGLGIRVRLQRSTAALYRLSITVKPGTHQSETQVNKQLNDKERVAAACENPQLENVVGKMLLTCKSLVVE